jgi:hypothetical protein
VSGASSGQKEKRMFYKLAALALVSTGLTLHAQTSTTHSRCDAYGNCTATTQTQPDPWAETQRRNQEMEETNRRNQERLAEAQRQLNQPRMCTVSVIENGVVVLKTAPCQ